MRAQLEKKMAQKEKEKKEENLRKLAQKAREERAGIKTGIIVSNITAFIPILTSIKFKLQPFVEIKFIMLECVLLLLNIRISVNYLCS